MKRVAAIDIGTNTFLLLVAEVERGSVLRTIHDEVEIVRIGQGVNQSKMFAEEALVRAENCLRKFSKKIKELECDSVKAVATSAARDVKNKSRLLEIGSKFDVPIDIISGEQEARLTFNGVLTNTEIKPSVAVIDVGGGSTEVTYMKNKQIHGQSRDLGGVRLTEMFLRSDPPTQTEILKMNEYIRQNFQEISPLDVDEMVAVAGTPTTIVALELGIDYLAEKIEGYRLSCEKLEHWINKLSKMNLKERSGLKGLEPKRADIIIAGASVLLGATRAYGFDQITVSTRGVRYGLAAELGD